MEIKTKQFKIIGITVRTTNENDKAMIDIPALWTKFLSGNLIEKIPNKLSSEIYCIYTEYEKDHSKPYTTLIGCRVENSNEIPDGMIGKEFESGKYQKFTAKGDLTKGAVVQEWSKIWNSDLERIYTADFEVYGEKSQNPENSEVEIYVAIK